MNCLCIACNQRSMFVYMYVCMYLFDLLFCILMVLHKQGIGINGFSLNGTKFPLVLGQNAMKNTCSTSTSEG